jgi:hypothetical protein
MKTRTKIWLGVGAFVMAGGGAPDASSLEARALLTDARATDTAIARVPGRNVSRHIVLAEAKQGGEGGEGGEAGINVAAADSDAVAYGIALQVIAAHYHAGLAAYEAKETEAGAQMFAHGLSEVYVEMEDVFRRRGVTTLGRKLEAAVEAASAKKPIPQVRRRVQDVLAALAAAEKAGPLPSGPALAVKAEIVADLLDRAAAQYGVSREDKALEPYLDGLGFAVAARKEAAKVLPWLRGVDIRKAATLSAALKLASEAYPGVRRRGSGKVAPGKFLAAASAVKLAVSNWK